MEHTKIIEAEHISRHYIIGEQTLHALKDVSLQVHQGEFIALMGASGSGKTTLLNILGCVDKADEGTYQLNGQDVSSLNDTQLSQIRNKEIGFVFQNFNLLPRLDALDNVSLPLIYTDTDPKQRKELALEALEQVGLKDRAQHLPNQLSGGQRQRVAIARALINRPSLLLADEPTGNLDTKTSLEIMDLFAQLHDLGHTIIMVTHEEDIAQHAQSQILMKDGRIIKA